MENRILFIVHQTSSDPGHLGKVAQEFGFEPIICRHYSGEPLPRNLDDYAAAVLFGGPMSANDDHLPFIRAELDWLDVQLKANKPFLGICLGAQMLARVLGGTVMPHKDGFHEIGFYKVTAQPAGKDLFDDEQYFYQWHSEGFSLPSGNGSIQNLATSELFENQAFRLGNAYGVQFHPEITDAMLNNWITMVAHRMVLPGAQARDRQLKGHMVHGEQATIWLDRFFQNWLFSGNTEVEPLAASVTNQLAEDRGHKNNPTEPGIGAKYP